MTISIPTPILDALSAVKDDDGIRNYCLSLHSTPCRRQGPPQILSNLTAGPKKCLLPSISSPPEPPPKFDILLTIIIPTPILDALSRVKDDDGIHNYCLSRPIPHLIVVEVCR